MSQSQLIKKLEELKAKDYKSGITAVDLRQELKAPSRSTFYRNLRDALKAKQIHAEGNRYFIKT